MAPPGTRIIAHEKPDQRASWDPRGILMELMVTTWVQHWTTIDFTKFTSQKQKGRG
jgi:hypothetical protein